MNRSWVILALWAVPMLASAANVYRWVGKDGSVVFSDQPRPGAQKVVIPPANVYDPAKLPVPGVTGTAGMAGHAVYASLKITAPGPDATVRQNNGDVAVKVAIHPALRAGEGDTIVLLLDGSRLPHQYAAPDMVIPNVDRGTHTLEAQVVGPTGNVLTSSPVVTFHLMRFSALLAPNPAGTQGSPGPNVLSSNPNVRSQNPNVLSSNPNVLSPNSNIPRPLRSGAP
ncbi:MAG: DUF4124 domain-containing protein [Gammaproteobacteria bacterium]|nr:DUF4124 domain-containing protein [Gammaproteobacteria bacterium]